MTTAILKLYVNKNLLNAFSEIAVKRNVPTEQIEKEALVTYLRLTGFYEPTDNYEERRYHKMQRESKLILAQLKEEKRRHKKWNTRYEI